MIVEGSFESLNNRALFDLFDVNNEKVLNISYNKFLPDKLYIKNLRNNKEYVGQILHNTGSEEFVFYEDTTQLFHVWQKAGLGMPKFEIKSKLGDYSTKFVLRKRNIILLEGEKEVATILGSPPNYRITIENDDAFMVLYIAFAITTLIPLKAIYSLLS